MKAAAFDIAVIGAGASGLMAAVSAASAGSGKRVIVLEKGKEPALKLYATGNGRCNYLNRNASASSYYCNEAPDTLPKAASVQIPEGCAEGLVRVFRGLGIEPYEETEGRLYPRSLQASSVVRALVSGAERLGAKILCSFEVSAVEELGKTFVISSRDGRKVQASSVILACGGKAGIQYGCTGDGYRMAQACGHTVQKTLPSLTALETTEVWPTHLQGLSLKNTEISAMAGKKVLYREQGEMLFTHFGISGPIVLSMSCHLPEDLSACQVFLNLKPALTPEQLTARLQREFDAAPRRSLAHVLETLLPQRFAALFPEIAGIDGDKTCATVTRAERQLLQETLQHVPLHLHKRRPMAEAIVTRGGITVKEVDPATMQSRLMPGLFFCGEVLDVDAHTGGYNLHIAFSTGFLAGRSAAQMVLQQ